MDRPEPVERLTTVLSTARIAHETIFELHRRVTVLRPTQRSLELLATSARIVSSELPALLAHARRLQARWQDQSVLDPAGAEDTLDKLAAELDSVEPEAAELLGRQRRIAGELRSLLEEAGG